MKEKLRLLHAAMSDYDTQVPCIGDLGSQLARLVSFAPSLSAILNGIVRNEGLVRP